MLLTLRKTLGYLACAAAAMIVVAVLGPVSAEILAPVPPAQLSAPAVTAPPVCKALSEFARFDRPLRHTARRLGKGGPLTVVAIGSSSTAGAGASSTVANYPSRLAVELERLFPGHGIRVLNRGVNGEEAASMLARFDDGVIAERPQLVLWQLGTNAVLRDHPLKQHHALVREGVEDLKAAGADVVLIDPQYAPKVLAKAETLAMVDQIAQVAKEENIDLFRRFALMRDWYEAQHIPFASFVSPDGLHMNDWGYACWAKLLADAIAEAATRPIASAAAHTR